MHTAKNAAYSRDSLLESTLLRDTSAASHYQRHRLADLLPEMDADALSALTANIGSEGLDCPIIVYEGKILHAWVRYQACLASGTQRTFRDSVDLYRAVDPQELVLRQAFRRAQWTAQQAAMLAARFTAASQLELTARNPRDVEAHGNEVNEIPATDESSTNGEPA
jgi:hypothetical protein